MESEEQTDLVTLVRSHLGAFRSMACVGNVSCAKEHLEAIGEIVRAAVQLKQLPEQAAHIDVTELSARVRPHVVLRQVETSVGIVEQALRSAGILRDPFGLSPVLP